MSQTLKTNIGRQLSDSSDLSGMEGRSGPRIGATEANTVKSNKWDMRRERRVQDKIAKPEEGKAVCAAILQNLNKALATLRKGQDQVNMELNEHAEPGRAGAGKEQNAVGPVSPIADACMGFREHGN